MDTRRGQVFRQLLTLILCLVAGLFTPTAARAHDSALSSLELRVGDRGLASFMRVDAESARDILKRAFPARAKSFEAGHVLSERATIVQYFDDRFAVLNDGQRCPRDGVQRYELGEDGKMLLVELNYRCAASWGELELRSSLFFDEDIPHEIVTTLQNGHDKQRYFMNAKSSAVSVFDKKPHLVRRRIDAAASSSPSAALARPRGPQARRFRQVQPPPDAFSPERLKQREQRLRAASVAPPATPSAPEAGGGGTGGLPANSEPGPSTVSGAATSGLQSEMPSALALDADAVPLQAESSDFWMFLRDGFHHIFGGLDHILFVVALLFAVDRLRLLVAVISSFTLAHSLTLVACALELVRVSPKLVEPLIAASIIYVAVDNLLRRRADLRLVVVFGFGLWHGLGFGERLIGLDLPATELAWALFAFNLGVEVGQLAVVLPVFPLLLWLRRRNVAAFDRVQTVASLSTALIATWWLFERLFSG